MTDFRVLFSHFADENGAGWNRSFILAKKIAELGHEVTFMTTQRNTSVFPYRSYIKDGVKVVAFWDPFPRKFIGLGLSPISAILKSVWCLFSSFDVLHSDAGHRPSSGMPLHLYRTIKGGVYVSEWWDFFGRGGQLVEKPLLWRLTYGVIDNYMEQWDKKFADGVSVLSSELGRMAVELGVSDNAIKLIHGGADVDEIEFYADNKRNRSRFDIKNNTIVFLFIGMNTGELKDLDSFLASLSTSKIDYTIVTTGHKLPHDVIKSYGIQNNLKELGFLEYGEEFSAAISCADFGLLFLNDNKMNLCRWPNKLGDYLAAGRPVLCSSVGEMSEYVEKYPEFLFPLSSEQNLRLELEGVIDSYTENYKLIRNVAENELSWRHRSLLLNELYHDVHKNVQ